MTRIYVAGPLFCEAERSYNARIRDALKDAGFDVVLPQDSDLLFDPAKMCCREYAEESAEKVFRNDLRLIDSCDILVFNLDGRIPDEGACVELGYAYSKGLKVYGLKTDVRVSEYGIDNMMICGMLRGRVAGSIDALVKMLLHK